MPPYKEYYEQFSGDLEERAYYEGKSVQKFWHDVKLSSILKSVNENELLLDLGSGSGLISSFIVKKNNVVPVDISKKCIKNCKKLNHRLNGVVADASHLPFKSDCFDGVVCVELIEHLTNPIQCLNEIHRVLKNRGKLVLTTPNFSSLWPVTEYLWDVFGEGRDYRKQHISKFSINRLKKTLEKAGFKTKSSRTVFLFTPYISLISNKLATFLLPLEATLLDSANIGMLIVCASIKG